MNVRILYPCPICRARSMSSPDAVLCDSCRLQLRVTLRACDTCGSLYDPAALYAAEHGRLVCILCLPGGTA